jgi:hypothetical protein
MNKSGTLSYKNKYKEKFLIFTGWGQGVKWGFLNHIMGLIPIFMVVTNLVTKFISRGLYVLG